MSKEEKSRYTEAGVDIDKGNAFVQLIKPLVAATHGPGVMGGIGGFGAMFSQARAGLNNPILVSSTDGVGTKLKIAQMMGVHGTVGIDLVAMCVNDIIVTGAQPLFFLDYFACGVLDLDVSVEVVKGIAKGCETAQCSLIGGETAEMPGMYPPGEYDLAGFAVGAVDSDAVINGSKIFAGHQLIGLSSSGLHSNGYSLVRKICFKELGLTVDSYVPELGRTLGEELLEPTTIYVEAVTELLRERRLVSGIVNITGGGFIDNIPRVLPENMKAVIYQDTWQRKPIFDFLQDNGGISGTEMFRTFNNGIGMIIIVDPNFAAIAIRILNVLGYRAQNIGEVAKRDGSKSVEFV